MAAKTPLVTNLIGKKLTEDTTNETRNGRLRFAYHGLTGDEVSIVAAWLVENCVKVMVVDAEGHTAELFPTLFLLKDADQK